MKRTIQTDNVRWHELDDRAIPCPHARDHDRQSPYGVKAKTGMWITYRDLDAAGHVYAYRCGRVLGRVTAPAIVSEQSPSPAIDGHVSVLVLSDNHQFAYIRWIDPVRVAEVSTKPPAALLTWITGELPTADLVHKLSQYGTLSSSYIGQVDHHVHAWQHGVSPAAWDAGVRTAT